MKNIKILIFALVIFGCKQSEEKKDLATDDSELNYQIEIITKSYSIKNDNGKFVKDTVNMIQSTIVDQNKKEIANIYYNLDGTASWKDEYTYDESNRKIGSKYYEKGLQKSYYEYDLDSLDRRIAYRAKDVNTDTLLYDGASKYEGNGTLRKDGYINKNGEFKWNYEYYFDENGKELGYAYISLKSGKKFPRNYDYVKFNNDGEWIERNAIENDTVVGIEIREFKKIE